jgi:hypothetical protein
MLVHFPRQVFSGKGGPSYERARWYINLYIPLRLPTANHDDTFSKIIRTWAIGM